MFLPARSNYGGHAAINQLYLKIVLVFKLERESVEVLFLGRFVDQHSVLALVQQSCVICQLILLLLFRIEKLHLANGNNV